MGKRYFCDFCEKSFADLPNNRKKHINGGLHQRMRKQHYDAFRDAESILAEDSQKIPCKQLLRTGNCNFGPTCRFSHLTTESRLKLEMEIWSKRQEMQRRVAERRKVSVAPSLEEWLEKRAERPKKKVAPRMVLPDWTPPPQLLYLPSVPLSLQLPQLEDFMSAPRLDWG
ncbi:zinc finger matrin-type protein 5-like [Argonauta hians]